MIGLILIIVFWIISSAFSLKVGIEIICKKLLTRNRISCVEYEEFTSWNFLIKAINDELRES